ncbi:MAG: DUF3445 domain-containing protein, partial [Alphaproteobacteria bacterium]|nr:DUF3445 domain-containing protein [Alphaproteobacteria bacterium]
RDGDRHALVAGILCCPSKWRLADKIGHPIATVHGPVPGCLERLERPVDRFFDQLKPGRLVWRLNWLIHDDPALFQQGGAAAAPPIEAARVGNAMWLRVERQTLRRLPGSAAIVFTIRTHVTPLRHVVATRDEAAALAAAVRSMPPEIVRYRNMGAIVPPLLAWLDGWS